MITLGIIPARKCSKRLKNKNRLFFLGRPLIEWTIRFALKLKFLDDVVLFTDDRIIIKYIKKYNLVKIFNRPKYLSKDKTQTIEVILNVIKKYEKNYQKIKTIVLLQPTSPFRSIFIIKKAFKEYIKFKMKKSIVSTSKASTKFKPNGNFYIASKLFLEKNKSFNILKKTKPFVLKSNLLNIDIDTKNDFQHAKNLFKKNTYV